MKTAMVIALFAAAMFLDYIPGWKSRKKRGNLVYSMLLTISFIILFLFSVDVKLPSPSIVIQDFIETMIPLK